MSILVQELVYNVLSNHIKCQVRTLLKICMEW